MAVTEEVTRTETPSEEAAPPHRPTAGAGGPRPSTAGWAARAGFVAGLAAVALLYVFRTQPVRSDNLAAGLIVAIGALSLNVLVGYAGQISLGHQAFIGIGAFTSAYVITQSHQSFYAGVIAGVVIGAVQAVVLGLVALRVRGLYFGLVTLAWGFVGENSLFRVRSLTGGGAGQPAPRPGGFTSDRGYLLICAAFLTLVLLIDWRLVATKAGRALQALRESPQVAANYGVNVRAYTLFAFAIAGAYAGLAGALFASRRLTAVAVDFTFRDIALPYLIVTVVGGLRRRGGIVLFAILFAIAPDYLISLAQTLHFHWLVVNAGFVIPLISGVLAIVTLIFQPDGLGTLTSPVGKWLKGGPFSLGHGGGGGAEGISVRP